MAEIKAAQVKELRDRTGAGMMDAKKALVAAEGNMDEAIDILREKGVATAAKKADRISAEGLSYIHVEGNTAAVVEVNSETDYVSKNEQFQNLVKDIAVTIAVNKPATLDEAVELKMENGETIKDSITSAISTIGENITLRRFELVEKEDNETFGAYEHMGGSISVLTLIDGADEEVADLDELVRAVHHRDSVHDAVNTEDIEFGFCTEIMVRLEDSDTVEQEFDYDEFRNYLNELGDSLLVIADEEIVKVHVHTEKPGEVMNYGQKFGTLINIKVDNMREQHAALDHSHGTTHEEPTKKEVKDTAVIAVAAGDGIIELFESFSVDYVIKGGQTMNPSTQDFLDAMEEVPAKNYILLPNNSNIFMAANQAKEVSDDNAVVVEARTVQQGLSAMLAFNPDISIEENKEMMMEELQYVTSGQITFAIRDTEINGLEINKDDFMGLIDGEIKISNPDLETTCLETIKEMITEDSEIITLLYGENSSEELIDLLVEQLEELYPYIEVETHEGGQPVYPLLISVE